MHPRNKSRSQPRIQLLTTWHHPQASSQFRIVVLKTPPPVEVKGYSSIINYDYVHLTRPLLLIKPIQLRTALRLSTPPNLFKIRALEALIKPRVVLFGYAKDKHLSNTRMRTLVFMDKASWDISAIPITWLLHNTRLVSMILFNHLIDLCQQSSLIALTLLSLYCPHPQGASRSNQVSAGVITHP
jgi:hypothetical protein